MCLILHNELNKRNKKNLQNLCLSCRNIHLNRNRQFRAKSAEKDGMKETQNNIGNSFLCIAISNGYSFHLRIVHPI